MCACVLVLLSVRACCQCLGHSLSTASPVAVTRQPMARRWGTCDACGVLFMCRDITLHMDGHANHPQRASVTLGSFAILVRVLAYLSEHARGLPRIGASTCYPSCFGPRDAQFVRVRSGLDGRVHLCSVCGDQALLAHYFFDRFVRIPLIIGNSCGQNGRRLPNPFLQGRKVGVVRFHDSIF